jgi:hypothetical protein
VPASEWEKNIVKQGRVRFMGAYILLMACFFAQKTGMTAALTRGR